jgi:excisionase family DNA binding protein
LAAPPKQDADELLSIKEAAAVMGVCEKTIYRMVGSGALRRHAAGRAVRVRRGDLLKAAGG